MSRAIILHILGLNVSVLKNEEFDAKK